MADTTPTPVAARTAEDMLSPALQTCWENTVALGAFTLEVFVSTSCIPANNVSFISVSVEIFETGFAQNVLLDDIHKYTAAQWEVALAGGYDPPVLVSPTDPDCYQFCSRRKGDAGAGLIKGNATKIPRAWLEEPLRSGIGAVLAAMAQAGPATS